MHPKDDAYESDKTTPQPWSQPPVEQNPGLYEDPQHPVLPPVAPGSLQMYEHPAAPPLSSNPMGIMPPDNGRDVYAHDRVANDAHELPTISSPPLLGTALDAGRPPKKKRSKRARVTLVSLAALLLLGGAIFAWAEGPQLARDIRTSKFHTSEAKARQTLAARGSHITAAELQNLDATSAFFAVFANAAQQRYVQTTTGYYFSGASHHQMPNDVHRVSFDYTTKQFSYDADSYMQSMQGQPDKNRCIGTHMYVFEPSLAGLGWLKSSGNQGCSVASILPAGPNDGLNAGGLTKIQAQKFVDNLRNNAGLITINGASLTTHAGASYIRFDVTVHPKKNGTAGYLGMQYLLSAFRSTGLDPAKQPYTYLGAAAAGMRIAYYVDPATQLPVYTELRSTDILGPNGKPAGSQTYVDSHVEYTFGNAVTPLDLTAHNALVLTWPSDKL